MNIGAALQRYMRKCDKIAILFRKSVYYEYYILTPDVKKNSDTFFSYEAACANDWVLNYQAAEIIPGYIYVDIDENIIYIAISQKYVIPLEVPTPQKILAKTLSLYSLGSYE